MEFIWGDSIITINSPTFNVRRPEINSKRPISIGKLVKSFSPNSKWKCQWNNVKRHKLRCFEDKQYLRNKSMVVKSFDNVSPASKLLMNHIFPISLGIAPVSSLWPILFVEWKHWDEYRISESPCTQFRYFQHIHWDVAR